MRDVPNSESAAPSGADARTSRAAPSSADARTSRAAPTSLRERTRRAVQLEIAETALALFAERGYEATTIADIAAAVGMSPRSVFRYFATKEEIVISKLELGASDLLGDLAQRPLDEPVWTSLRRVFDVVGDADEQARTRPLQRVILETPALLAVYLVRLQGFEVAVAAVLRERAERAGRAHGADDPAPEALSAAAFGCFVAAQRAWLAADDGQSLEDHLDRAMATITPRD